MHDAPVPDNKLPRTCPGALDPGDPQASCGQDCGATSMYLYCADTSVSGLVASFLIWNTLTVRSARSPFSSNDTVPWMVGTFAVWIASRTFSRVGDLPDAATRLMASI